MKLIPPNKAYRGQDKGGKFHLLRPGCEVTPVCNHVLLCRGTREEKDVAQLRSDQLCEECWRFETSDEVENWHDII